MTPRQGRQGRVDEIVRPIVESLGYRLVRLMVERGRLQLMAEHQDYRPIGLEDCVRISHSVSAVLDADDIIPESYDLEVSSCGEKRPLSVFEDVSFFIGREAMFVVGEADDATHRWRGVIVGVTQEEQTVQLLLYDGSGLCHDVRWHEVTKAHLLPMRKKPQGDDKKNKKRK